MLAVSTGGLAGAGAVALLMVGSFLVASDASAPQASDATGRLRAEQIARDFLKANGIAPEPFEVVTYTATGFADDVVVRALRPDEFGRLPGVAEEYVDYIVRRGGDRDGDGLARG